ncbi:hypothetical protein NDU88_003816 [Pleurodeles waltl]|uniref:Uncharacterized protein n=1 Tax=Pleurodeles waltl TaxID=8319 RepID=A0AAV7PC88_PLEWA|nr:hypothetical protein NDU88_003816 [Pleurodeles waltl]
METWSDRDRSGIAKASDKSDERWPQNVHTITDGRGKHPYTALTYSLRPPWGAILSSGGQSGILTPYAPKGDITAAKRIIDFTKVEHCEITRFGKELEHRAPSVLKPALEGTATNGLMLRTEVQARKV